MEISGHLQRPGNHIMKKPVLEETFFLSVGEANPEQEMSIPLLISKLIDIATAHANSLDIGNPSMNDFHGGWVLSRLTLEMNQYPPVNSTYTVSTWIEGFNRHFSERAFRISSPDGFVYGYARSIWMVIDTETHESVSLSHFSLPGELISGEKPPIPRQAKHAPIVDASCPDIPAGALIANAPHFDYRFKYCDLDSYRHVNTVRYVQLLLNRFSLEDFDTYFVRRLELSFLHEAKYNMNTRVMRCDSFSEMKRLSCFLLKNADDDTPIMFARMELSARKT